MVVPHAATDCDILTLALVHRLVSYDDNKFISQELWLCHSLYHHRKFGRWRGLLQASQCPVLFLDTVLVSVALQYLILEPQDSISTYMLQLFQPFVLIVYFSVRIGICCGQFFFFILIVFLILRPVPCDISEETFSPSQL